MDKYYSEVISESLIGKTIASAKVNGHFVILVFDDGEVFEYDASDGGYSSYDLKKGK